MGNLIKHFKKICKHKYEVGKVCFKFGLYKQGILHDISKFNPKEFLTSVKYYQGNRSPIEAEKEDKGYSMAWLHHFHNNPHHWCYWIDFDMKQNLTPYKMPYKYMLESIADWIGAGKAYNGKKYTFESGFKYYRDNIRINNEVSSKIFHKDTRMIWDIIMVDLLLNGFNKVCDMVRIGYYKDIYENLYSKNQQFQKDYLRMYETILMKYFS